VIFSGDGRSSCAPMRLALVAVNRVLPVRAVLVRRRCVMT